MTLLAADDAQEAAALAGFRRENPSARFETIAVILPSYREAASIADVLREIPREVKGRAVTTLVVVDGPDDGASQRAREHGAFVCSTGGHRGQGAALRLGYRLAVAHGAAFLVSLDADGQYAPAEIPLLLAPLLGGEADFVSGSRRLGHDVTSDRLRSLGVTVFAAILRTMTGQRVTDPAFGLRAFTAEVAQSVTLSQPQYQAAELLIGVALRGFRLAERPGTIRPRTHGETRKGPGLLYGARFARVVVATWWRERGRKVAEACRED